MKKPISALISGILFALGLGISGMSRPSKNLAFLTLSPDWDPTLMFVLGSALAVFAANYLLTPDELRNDLPKKQGVCLQTVTGAIAFGLGWGLIGFCPGPALVALVSGSTDVMIFVASMSVGMFTANRIQGLH